MRASSSARRLGGNRGREKSPGRKLDPRQADRRPLAVARGGAIGREIVARARIEQRVVGHRAGRDDARHFALHEPLGLLRVLHLLADRGAIAGGDQLAEVASS